MLRLLGTTVAAASDVSCSWCDWQRGWHGWNCKASYSESTRSSHSSLLLGIVTQIVWEY